MSDPGSERRFHPPGRLTVRELLAATGGRLVRGEDLDREHTLCTDTRELGPGALFVALRGEVHDGHRFVSAALARHGVGAVVEERALAEGLDLPGDAPIIAVADSLLALGAAGRAALRRVHPRVAAITGSVGKTTTRAMLGSMLARTGPGLETEGNFNNRIGLPLTLLSIRPEHRWAVLELGMSEPGEIRALAAIAEPSVRVITEVAPAHLEFFASVEQIADAKGELFEQARPDDTLIFPADNPLSDRFPRPRGTRLMPFSTVSCSADLVHATQIEDHGLAGTRARLHLPEGAVDVRIPLPGLHQVHNALAAAAAASAMGVSRGDIAAGLATLVVPGRRMLVRTLGGVTVLDDAYNANPLSVVAGLNTLAALRLGDLGARRIAVLGDMLELGPTGPDLHADVGRLAVHLGLDLLVGAGPLMRHAVEAVAECAVPGGRTRAVHTASAEEAGHFIAGWLRAGDVVLVKGSRGMRMEGALHALGGPA